jgi:hypothetical protein
MFMVFLVGQSEVSTTPMAYYYLMPGLYDYLLSPSMGSKLSIIVLKSCGRFFQVVP